MKGENPKPTNGIFIFFSVWANLCSKSVECCAYNNEQSINSVKYFKIFYKVNNYYNFDKVNKSTILKI